jgi:hypothetical protein
MTAGNIKAVVYDERKSKYKAIESPNCVVNQPEKEKEKWRGSTDMLSDCF